MKRWPHRIFVLAIILVWLPLVIYVSADIAKDFKTAPIQKSTTQEKP